MISSRLILTAALACFSDLAPARPADQPAANPAENVVLVMIDGLRWQEVFTGADERYVTKAVGKVEKPEPLLERWHRGTPEERRETLMPFLWSVVAREGQLYGNRYKGSTVDITNGRGVSYPGYAEALCGVAEPVIKDNRHIVNPNPTVLEFLNQHEGFRGRAAAFGSWQTFRFIFRAETCGFPVDDGNGAFTAGAGSPELAVLNRVRTEVPYRWSGVAFDALTVNTAMEWMKVNKPRAVFLGMGETDEWAHEYDYARYLEAAHLADAYLRRLWEYLQSDAQYAGKTTLMITCDHGRGDLFQKDRAWGDHGSGNPGSEHIWLAIIGPGIRRLGERTNTQPITQSQFASTLAAAAGLDFSTLQPRAGVPIRDCLPVPPAARP